MYKRLAATALLVLALWSAPPLFAQYSSFLYRSSFGLFDTPLDAATTTREMGMLNTFSELAQRYVFGDLTNFASLATGGNVSTPFTFGVYRPGSSASSLVVGLMVDTTPSGALNGVDPASIVVAPVLKPVGTTDYPWIERSDRNTYAFIDAWDISASGQALMHFGTANAGIAFSGGFLQNSGGLPINTWTGNNVTTVRSFYYDAAAIDAAPNPATNYTLTISRSEPDTSVSVSLNIPVYLSLGKLGLQLTPGGSFQYADTSYTNRQTYSAPAQAAPGTFPNVLTLSSLIRRDAAASGGISGTLFLPFLQVGQAGATPVPPFQVSVGWGEAAWLCAAFGLVFLATLAGMMATLLRLKIFQAVKMGEAV